MPTSRIFPVTHGRIPPCCTRWNQILRGGGQQRSRPHPPLWPVEPESAILVARTGWQQGADGLHAAILAIRVCRAERRPARRRAATPCPPSCSPLSRRTTNPMQLCFSARNLRTRTWFPGCRVCQTVERPLCLPENDSRDVSGLFPLHRPALWLGRWKRWWAISGPTGKTGSAPTVTTWRSTVPVSSGRPRRKKSQHWHLCSKGCRRPSKISAADVGGSGALCGAHVHILGRLFASGKR